MAGLSEGGGRVMKKIRKIAALALVLSLVVSTSVWAAPSPRSGLIWLYLNYLWEEDSSDSSSHSNTPSTSTLVTQHAQDATVASVAYPTVEELSSLTVYITQNAALLAMTPNVKSVIKVNKPAGYTGGLVPTVTAVAGLKNGASNVYAYIRGTDGKFYIMPCAVYNGYVGFYTPAFGTVAIVQLDKAATGKAAGKKLH